MPEYRGYVIGDDGHFAGFRAFVCASDADAKVWPQQLVDGHDVELWSGTRLVIRLVQKPRSGPPQLAASFTRTTGGLARVRYAVGSRSNMLASETFKASQISNRRAALTRFTPFSYFCTC